MNLEWVVTMPSSHLCSSSAGASFTRFQTLRLQKIFPESLANQLISYGSCQFPTLGFVVERFKAIQAFIPEIFYKIKGTNSSHKSKRDPTTLGFKLTLCSFVCVCICLSAPWSRGRHCGVQLEKKPSLQPHSLPGALPDMHGGMFLFICVCFTLTTLMCVCVCISVINNELNEALQHLNNVENACTGPLM